MAAFKTWLESIEADFPDKPYLREWLVQEMPHTHFSQQLPHGFEFLSGSIVDLGIENLGLPQPELRKIMLAFGKTGVGIPDTQFRLRNVNGTVTVIEPADGSEEATLPRDWREAIYVIGKDDKITFVGKKVRPDQIPGVDLSQYKDIGYGYVLV